MITQEERDEMKRVNAYRKLMGYAYIDDSIIDNMTERE